MPPIFETVGTGASSSSETVLITTGFSFGVALVVSIAPGVLLVGLTHPVTPITIKTNVSNIIIFLSVSLLTAVFTTARCVYLVYDYDVVF